MIDALEIAMYPCLYISLDEFGNEIINKMIAKGYQKIEYRTLDTFSYKSGAEKYDYIIVVGRYIEKESLGKLASILNSNAVSFKVIFSLTNEMANQLIYPNTHYLIHNDVHELELLIMYLVGLTCKCGNISIGSADIYDCIMSNREVKGIHIEGNSLAECVQKAFLQVPQDSNCSIIVIFSLAKLSIPTELLWFREKLIESKAVKTFIYGTQEICGKSDFSISLYLTFWQ